MKIKDAPKYVKVIIEVAIIIIIYMFVSNFMDSSFVKNNHFNIVTVNSVFAGFLFTALSILITVTNEDIINYLEEGSFMSSIYDNIIRGLKYSLTSIVLSLFNNFILENPIKNNMMEKLKIKTIYFYNFELLFLILAIICFIMSVLDIKFVIVSIRTDKKRKIENDKNEDEIRRKLNLPRK
jgi:hypothetical protein